MLLSCEAAVRRQISCTRSTLTVNITLSWQRRAHCEVRTGFPVETLQKGPQSEERASLCGSLSLSLSLTAAEDGKWCQSIHQSNTGGCAERRAGGVVMAACRGARRMIMTPCCNHFRSLAIADAAEPQKESIQIPQGLALCLAGPPSRHLCPVVDAPSPRLVRLKEGAALIKDV